MARLQSIDDFPMAWNRLQAMSGNISYNYWGLRWYYINLKKPGSYFLSRYTFRNSCYQTTVLPDVLLLQSDKKNFPAISCSINTALGTLKVKGEKRGKNHLKNVNIADKNTQTIYYVTVIFIQLLLNLSSVYW